MEWGLGQALYFEYPMQDARSDPTLLDPTLLLQNIPRQILVADDFLHDMVDIFRVDNEFLTGTIGLGSFFFHTVPNHFTMWLDIAPIALFQVSFLWLASNKMLSMSRLVSAGIVVGVLGLSFALMPLHEVMNGSLFYVPSLVAMLAIGIMWAETGHSERYLLLGAAFCFLLAITARSIDWSVPWNFGTHFLWHVLNGVVVYMALRAWIVFVSWDENMAILATPLTELRSTINHERTTQEWRTQDRE